MDKAQLFSAGKPSVLLNLIRQSGLPLSLKAGMILKAEVMDIMKGNTAILRLLIPNIDNKTSRSSTIKVNSEVPLTKGQKIYLEVKGDEEQIKMRIVPDQRPLPVKTQQQVPARILNLLSQLSQSKANGSELRFFLNMIKSLPPNIRTLVPEFANIEKLFLKTEKLDGKQLKAFVESSGVAFETKLKILALKDPGSLFRNFYTVHRQGDFKAELIALIKRLKEQNITRILQESGLKTSKIINTVERLIGNIELFQINSRINDMFYTFLPLFWDSLRDGEIMFRKKEGQKKNGYTCDINLDLETIGKLAISITMSDNAFYISFNTERPEVAVLVRSQREVLQERFSSKGLPLKALNISHKKNIAFGIAHAGSASIKI